MSLGVDPIQSDLPVLKETGTLLDSLSSVRAWRRFEHFARPFAIVRLSGLVMVIPTMINIYRYSIKLFEAIRLKAENQKERVINNTLHLLSELSNLFYRFSALVQELKLLKLLSSSTTSLAPIAIGVSAPLQFARLAVNIREWKSTKEAESMTIDEYQSKDGEWFSDHFWVGSGEVLKGAISKEKQSILKQRLWSKKLCHVLESVSVVIGLIATAAFLCSPLAPIGYIFFTAGVILATGIWIYNAYCHHCFIHDMGIEKRENDTVVVRIYKFCFPPPSLIHQPT
jgi:hypothetical protein